VSFLFSSCSNAFQSSGGDTCIAPFNDFELLTTGLYVPLISLGFLGLNCLIHFLTYTLVKAGKCHERFATHEYMESMKAHADFSPLLRRYRRTALGFLVASCKCLIRFLHAWLLL
jgi:hypothetical protein